MDGCVHTPGEVAEETEHSEAGEDSSEEIQQRDADGLTVKTQQRQFHAHSLGVAAVTVCGHRFKCNTDTGIYLNYQDRFTFKDPTFHKL